MNKRGVVLIFSTLAIVLLSGFLGSFFMQTMGETLHTRRQADSATALWLAEAGIAKVKSLTSLPTTTTAGSIPNSAYPNNSYTFSVTTPVSIGAGCYTFTSTGTVTSPGSVVKRAVAVTMKIIPPDVSNIDYSLETTSNNLTFQSQGAEKYLTNTEDPANLYKKSSNKTFQAFFGVDMATMKARSKRVGNLYAQSTSLINSIDAVGVTWIDVPSGQELQIEHLNNLTSTSSIVIINGNFKLNGNGNFKGVLYVIGTLEMLGNATVQGTTFVESSASIGVDLTGSALISYRSAYIAESFNSLSSKTIVSWQEVQL